MRTTIVLVLLSVLAASDGLQAQTTTEPNPPAAEPAVRIRRGPSQALSPAARAAAAAARARRKRLDPVTPSDDGTFRPTVIVRRGTSQGSGSVIASVDDDTLVLTAAHVVKSDAPILIELHRYNLGLERRANAPGRWPRRVPAELVSADASADVAIVRVRKMVALPYVAKLFDDDQDALPDDVILTSIGIDLGEKLSSWTTELAEIASFQLNDSDLDRPFLITAKPPEHGRSGGGLFTEEGRLVGVCVGHAEMIKGRRMGVFSAIENVRRILREHDLVAVVDRSTTWHQQHRRAPGSSHSPARAPSPPLTPTGAGSRRR